MYLRAMKTLTVLDKVAVRKPKDFDVEDYFSQIFSMYDGPECDVDILCENDMMKHVIDQFGEKVKTNIVDNKHFLASVRVSLSPTFYAWVFSFAGKMIIKNPKEAIDGFQKMIKQF